MIIGDSGSGKTNALLNLVKEQDDIDKIYLYANDLNEPNMNFWSKSVKIQEQNISIIQMHLLSVQVLWMTFMRILMTTIQAEKGKF